MSNDPVSPDMTNRADYWARLMADSSDAIPDEVHAAFQAWLFESEENQLNYRRAVTLMQLVGDLSPAQQSALISPSGDTRGESDRVESRRNIMKFAAFAASAAVVLVTGGLYLEHRGFFGETHSTGTGETETVRLSEGSVAYLNTRTQIRWIGRGNERRVELISGEALFDVAHDASRPFTVLLDGSEIRVLGTRFNVHRKGGGDVEVTVLEGTVEVRGFGSGSTEPQWIRQIHANQQMEYRPIGLVREVHQTNSLASVAWREGRYQLPVDGEPLAAVVDELTRYTDQRIVISDERAAIVNVGGAIKINTRDVRAALHTLELGLPIKVRETEGSFVIDYSARERD